MYLKLTLYCAFSIIFLNSGHQIEKETLKNHVDSFLWGNLLCEEIYFVGKNNRKHYLILYNCLVTVLYWIVFTFTVEVILLELILQLIRRLSLNIVIRWIIRTPSTKFPSHGIGRNVGIACDSYCALAQSSI